MQIDNICSYDIISVRGDIMTEKQQIAAAGKFKLKWKDKGSSEKEMIEFWIELLRDVFGVKNVDEHIIFDEQAHRFNSVTHVDAYIPSAKVVIEQKPLGMRLDTVDRRSLFGMKNIPMSLEHALAFSNKMILSKKPRYVIGCNFETFFIYDLDKEDFENNYDEIKLHELENKFHMLDFIVGKETDPIKQLYKERKLFWDKHKQKKTPEDFAWYYISQTIKEWTEKNGIGENRIASTLINTTFIEKNRVYDILKKCLGKKPMKKIKVPDRRELFKFAVAMDLDEYNRKKFISVMQPDMPYPFNDVDNLWESSLQKLLEQTDTKGMVQFKLISLAETLKAYGTQYNIFNDLKKTYELADKLMAKESDKNNYTGAEYEASL